MPPKKTSSVPAKPAAEPPAVVPDANDPVGLAISIMEKKVRNLEKRRNKLQGLKESALELGGDALDKDQQEAITKIKDVDLQLELVRDLQKQFASLQTEYLKTRKRQQRQERQQAKEVEREAELKAELKAVAYALRIQDMLNSFGEDDKDNFRTASEGAVKLSDEELSQIDELYKLINPGREDNSNYDSDLMAASDHMVLLKEANAKEVFGTTYKSLHEVLDRVDKCGYFNHPPRAGQDEQDSEEEDADDFKSADEQVTPQHSEGVAPPSTDFTEEVDIPPEVPPMVEPEPPTQYLHEVMPPGGVNHGVMGNPTAAEISQANNIMNSYMPPSPTFPALGAGPVLMTHEDGFSFMHDSEVDRKQQRHSPITSNSPFTTTSQQITHQAPPSLVQSHLVSQQKVSDYHVPYDNRVGVASPGGEQNMMSGSVLVGQPGIQGSIQGTTDVTTGQPSPSLQPSYQSTVIMDTTATGIMTSSAPPTNHIVGVANSGGGGEALYSSVMPEVPSGYRQQPTQNQPYNSNYRGSSQNKGGRGAGQGGGAGGVGRRPGGQSGSNRGNYGNSRNGRGGMQGQGGQGYESKGYAGAGGAGGTGGGSYQQQRGGRPNYRTNTGGQKRS